MDISARSAAIFEFVRGSHAYITRGHMHCHGYAEECEKTARSAPKQTTWTYPTCDFEKVKYPSWRQDSHLITQHRSAQYNFTKIELSRSYHHSYRIRCILFDIISLHQRPHDDFVPALLSHHVWLTPRMDFQVWCKQWRLSHCDCTIV